MLSRFSIRSKIIAVVAFMTIAMTVLGVFAVFQMRTINAAAHEIQSSWLPSVAGLARCGRRPRGTDPTCTTTC
jgi:methyl-accepting chemotaxis protein